MGADGASIAGRYLSGRLVGRSRTPIAPAGVEGGDAHIAKKYEICLRLNQAEAAKLRVDAKRCGLSKTAYLRRLLNGSVVRERPTESIDKLRTEVHHIGNNINQLARKFNAGFGTKEDARQAVELMEQVYRLMYEIAKE